MRFTSGKLKNIYLHFMIFSGSLASVLEAIYLKEPVTSSFKKAQIAVNPKNLDYFIGKVIIFNRQPNDLEVVRLAVRHFKTVIARVKFMDESLNQAVTFQPYITRIDSDLTWDGQTIRYDGEEDIDSLFCDIPENGMEVGDGLPEISIPKVLGLPQSALYDPIGNLTCLGWALHQVGVNLDPKARYRDLDLIKTWKVW